MITEKKEPEKKEHWSPHSTKQTWLKPNRKEKQSIRKVHWKEPEKKERWSPHSTKQTWLKPNRKEKQSIRKVHWKAKRSKH